MRHVGSITSIRRALLRAHHNIHEATATAEYKLRYYISTRLEFRDDTSDQRVFGREPGGLSRDRTTVMLAFLFSLKGER